MCAAKVDDTLSSTAILIAFRMAPRGTEALLVGEKEFALWPVVEVAMADDVAKARATDAEEGDDAMFEHAYAKIAI